jgi:Ca2+-binding RTX toxin-like protein
MTTKVGTPGSDTLLGQAGSDHLSGAQGSDSLSGGSGDDLLFGGAGNDVLAGEGGSDTLSGSDGLDEASYRHATSGIRVDLAEGSALSDGQGGKDRLISIEVIRGSEHGDLISLGSGDERARGDKGRDTLLGQDGDDQLDGGLGADFLYGGDGNDSLRFRDATGGVRLDFSAATAIGGSGTDRVVGIEVVQGSTFNDTLLGSSRLFEMFTGRAGADTINGRTGQDRVSYAADEGPRGVTADLATGVARDSWGATDRLLQIEQLEGTDLSDRLRGDQNDNLFRPRAGSDTIDGRAGIDRIEFGTTRTGVVVDLVHGQARDGTGSVDRLISIEVAKGTALADSLFGDARDNLLDGSSGNDRISGANGADSLYGGNNQDWLTGGNGTDTLDGGNGNDWLYGGNASDTLSGKNGNDLIKGESGSDSLKGGNEDDRLFGGDGTDSVKGENGDDWIQGLRDEDKLSGGNGADTVYGGNNDDTVRGDDGTDQVYGGADNDRLDGGAGGDRLYGGVGADRLSGEAGTDTLTGGSGRDRFMLGDPDDGSDIVADFGATDRLDLRGVVAGFGSGDDPDDFVQFAAIGGNTRVLVDADGSGGDFALVATLLEVTGLRVENAFDGGQLILS